MVQLLSSLIIFLICLKQSVLTIAVRKFVYQKDMSEYCRRRVVPSVFLGRQVAEAHSQILHFSRMELPYSCFISVRAESGSNVVLVVQLLSDESLVNACAGSPSQLLVYEMGETFGGYWGPLPDSVIRPEPTEPEIYTMKTTEADVTRRIYPDYDETTAAKKETQPAYEPAPAQSEREREGDFIRVEVPIVNVSGKLVPEGGELQSAYDIDEIFDLLYDVTPRAKQQYYTTIVPLVQFSLDVANDGRRGEEVRYNLGVDYGNVGKHTTDARLTFPHYSERTAKRKNSRTNFYVNKLLSLTKTRGSHRSTKHTPQYFRKTKHTPTASSRKGRILDKISDTDLYKSSVTSSIENKKTWEEIENILRQMNESSSHTDKYDNEHENLTSLLETISNMKHNKSAYLLPDWDSFNDQPQQYNQVNTITKRFSGFTRKPLASFNYVSKNIHQFLKSTKTSSSFVTRLTSESTTTINSKIKYSSLTEVRKSKDDYKQSTSRTNENHITSRNEQYSDPAQSFVIERSAVNKQTQSITPDSASKTKPVTGSLVDHESWENVVLAAPVIAELLNQTADTLVNYTTNNTIQDENNTVPKQNGIRIKRKIQPIPIENARPHILTTREFIPTTPSASYGVSDMQEFAQLVELQDDELHERVALRYLRHYTGPLLFNICDYMEPNARHVYLFNSSRVVLAIHNFTMERMTVMLTPSYTLLSGVARCSDASLECQVYGTRICIDSLNACDGVPNCGAYDIYDEDRLMCGAAAGLQHNVYLAAITVLAVLMTLMYTVHYWLRRCVPKVSEAFFIYTDGAENILYLDSIMRSPNDIYEGPKMTYQPHLFDDADYMSPLKGKLHRNKLFRILKACFTCCKCCKRKEKELSDDIMIDEPPFTNMDEPRQMYSFAEFELSKMMSPVHPKVTDASAQTGDSLEIPKAHYEETKTAPFELKYLPVRPIDNRRGAKFAGTSEDSIHKHINELNMIKLCKELSSEQRQTASLASATSDVSEILELSLHKPSYEDEEEELQSHFYDHHHHHHPHEMPGTSHNVITTTCDIHSERPKTSKQARKCLRFEEETITIPSFIEGAPDDDYEDSKRISGDRKKKDHDAEFNPQGSGRDFKRFWKGKKSKKKAHLALH